MFNCPQPSSQFKKAIKSTGSNPEKGGEEKGKNKGKNKEDITISSFLPTPSAFEHVQIVWRERCSYCPALVKSYLSVRASCFPWAA